jgi:N-acetylglutamate synthase
MRDRRPSVQRYRDAYVSRDLVRELEDLLARAWPPLTVLELDGWHLRAARGFAAHANSVLPRASGNRITLPRKLDVVERFYRQRNLPVRYQVGSSAAPRELRAALAARGYAPAQPRRVQTATMERLLAARLPAAGGALELAEEPGTAWLERWAALAGRSAEETAVAAEVFRRVRPRSAYVTLESCGRDVAAARAVLDGAWLGIVDVTVAADATNDATDSVEAQVIEALLPWAAAGGAERVYREVGPRASVAPFRDACAFRYWVASR